MKKTLFSIAFLGLGTLLQGGTFDFLAMPMETISRPGVETEAIRIWEDPAGLASLGTPVTLAAGAHTRMGVSLFAATACARGGDFSFAVSGSMLTTGPMTGDLQFAGDAGRALKSGHYLAGGALAWRLGDSLHLPFAWNLGVAGKYVTETLDTVEQYGMLVDASMQGVFNLGPKVRLSMVFAGGNLPALLSGAKAETLPTAFTGTLGLHWAPANAFGLRLGADARVSLSGDLEPGAAAEIQLFHALSLNARGWFGPSPMWSVGAAIHLTFESGSAGTVLFAHLPGEGTGASTFLLATGIGKNIPNAR